VENLDKDVAKASKRTNDQYNKLKKDLDKLKIEDLVITTSGYNVFELKEWENNKSVSKGFKATLGMTLESNKLESFSEIIRVANAANVTNISGFNTFLSLNKQKQLDLECLKVASKNAFDKAQVLAQELKGKLGSVAQISEVAQSVDPGPMPMGMEMKTTSMMAVGDGSSAPEVSSGQTEYRKRITVSFELL
jgi:uncharacterized protein YggE